MSRIEQRIEHDEHFMQKLGQQIAVAYSQFGDIIRFIRQVEAKEAKLEARLKNLENIVKNLKYKKLDNNLERE